MLSVLEVSAPQPDRVEKMRLMVLVGVVTDVRKSVTEEMDMDAIVTMKPVHSAHESDEPGFSKPATPESRANLLVFLASGMSMEISGAVIPIDHAWSTI